MTEPSGASGLTLADKLDTPRAIDRTLANVRYDPIPNRLDQATLRQFSPDFVKRAAELLSDPEMNWANGSARYFDLPRSDNLVRPICYVDADVRVVYQALVDSVSASVEPYIHDRFSGAIFSHRLRGPQTSRMFEDARTAYGKFVQAQHEEAESKRFSFCVRLDIATYYERVYQHKLQQLLERRGVSGDVASALATLLRKFASGDSHGIPQGLWPSDYLGNIYLLYLDEYLADEGIYAIRYVDDYRIFCFSLAQARSVLKACCAVLREMGLAPNSRKTDIIPVEQLNPELKPLTRQYLELRSSQDESLEEALGEAYAMEDAPTDAPVTPAEATNGGLTESVIRAFERLWTNAVDEEDKRRSILSYALAGLSAGGSRTAEQQVLTNLADNPHLSSVVTKYLSSLGFKMETAESLLTFLESADCVQEWQQVWIVEYFRGAGTELSAFAPRLLRIAQDAVRHPLVRGSAAEVLGSLGTDAHGQAIKRLFTEATDPRLRRSLLYAFRLLPALERNYAISYLPPSDWNLKLVGRLVAAGNPV